MTTLPNPIKINHPKNKILHKFSTACHGLSLNLTQIIVGSTNENWMAIRPPRIEITYLILGNIIAIQQLIASTRKQKMAFSFWLNSSRFII